MTDDLLPAQVTGIEKLCQEAERLAGAVTGPLKSVRLQAGDLAVEVQWCDPQPGVSVPPVVNGHVRPGLYGPAERTAGPGVPESTAVEDDTRSIVRSPLVGTFYRSPSPDSPPFADVGDQVEAGQQVAIVEAMKLMNPVDTDQAGRIAEVLVPDGTPVEYGQALFVLVTD